MTREPGHAPGVLRAGSVGGVDLLVSASCLLVVGLLAVALAPRLERAAPGLDEAAYAVGALVGVLVYVAALLHESAHALLARRYGHRVESITLSVTGGRTAVDGEARTPAEELLTAASGPVASLLVGMVALGVRTALADGLVAVALEVLVLANLVLGLLDLVPAPPLDGGRIVKALAWRVIGSPRRGAMVAAWVGRGVALALLLAPTLCRPVLDRPARLSDYVVCGALALLLWTVATNELAANRLRLRLGGIVVGDLARPALSVPPDLPLAEAVRRADEAGAGGIVTVDSGGRPLGLVSATAVAATPAEKHPWVATSTVTRRLDALTCLPADLDGDQLLSAVRRGPAAEYLLVDAAGAPHGVLTLRDVDRVVRLR